MLGVQLVALAYLLQKLFPRNNDSVKGHEEHEEKEK